MAIRTIQDVGEPPFMGLSYNSWKVKYECPSYEEVIAHLYDQQEARGIMNICHAFLALLAHIYCTA